MSAAVVVKAAPAPARPKACKTMVSIQRDLQEWWNALAAGIEKPFDSGLRGLDKKSMGWLCPQDLTILAGRPGAGKSALAQQIAEYVAKSGQWVLFLSLDMPGRDLVLRRAARQSKYPLGMLKSGIGVTEEVAKSLEWLIADVANTKIEVVDTIFDIATLMKTADEFAAWVASTGEKLGLVIIDHLQKTEAVGQNRNLELAVVTKELKHAAKRLNVPVLALSQLGREVESQNRRPRLSDLRDSGNIEQDADTVAYVHRDDCYTSADEHTGLAEIGLLKLRCGANNDTITMRFDGPSMTFSDVEDAPRARRVPGIAAAVTTPRWIPRANRPKAELFPE